MEIVTPATLVVAEPFNKVLFVKVVKLVVNAFTETILVVEVSMTKIASSPNN